MTIESTLAGIVEKLNLINDRLARVENSLAIIVSREVAKEPPKLYLNESEVAVRYGYSRQWFQRERWKGTGPRYLKERGKILYPLKETDEWFAMWDMKQNTSE